jgi:hypothetical protein
MAFFRSGQERPPNQIFALPLMSSLILSLAVLAVLITLPVAVLLWLTESKQQRARRQRRAGHSCSVIGARLGVTHQQVSAWCRA